MIVGRLCQAPIQVHQLIKAFQKTEPVLAERDALTAKDRATGSK